MNLLKYILAALALVLGAVLVPTLASAEDSGEPCVETEDRTETAWFETDPGAPWVATGESREKTPAGEDTVETSGWLTAPPAGEGWEQTAQRTVNGALISPAVDLWWHWNGSSNPTAAPPAAGWESDPGEHSGIPAPPNTIYNESHGQSGNASWFYHQVTAAVYQQVTEYMYQRTIAGTPAVMEHEYSQLIEGTDCPPDGDEPPVEECPEGQVGIPPSCEDEGDEDPETPVEECPEGQVGTPPSCEDGDDGSFEVPGEDNPGGSTGTPPSNNPGTTSPTGTSGGGTPTGPAGTTSTDDNPLIETPGPGEEVVFQSFDRDGNLVEQRVSQPIPGEAEQEGM